MRAGALLGLLLCIGVVCAEPPEKGAVYPERVVLRDAPELPRPDAESKCRLACADRWNSGRLDALYQAKIPLKVEVLIPMKFGSRSTAYMASNELDAENCRIVPLGNPPFWIREHSVLRMVYVSPQNKKGSRTAVFLPEGVKDYQMECSFRAHVGVKYIHRILDDRGIMDLKLKDAVRSQCEQECKVRVVRDGDGSGAPRNEPAI